MESRPLFFVSWRPLAIKVKCLTWPGYCRHDFQLFVRIFQGMVPMPGPVFAPMEELAEGINDLLLDYEEEPVYVFGYSMGGYAAALYAARHKNRIRALVTYGTKWLWSDEIANNEISFWMQIDYQGTCLCPKLQKPIQEQVIWFARCNPAPYVGSGQRHQLYQQHLKSIDIPVFVLWGENDQMVGVDDLECITVLSSHFQSGELPKSTPLIRWIFKYW